MDQIGLIAKIQTSVAEIYQGRQWLNAEGLEGEGRISFQDGLALGIEAFREAQKRADDDLHMLFVAEYTFLVQELEFCAPQDAKARTSLSKAVQEFDEAFLALEVLQNAEGYRLVEKVLSHRPEFRYIGMPKDAVHVACGGHKARLDNILKSPGINLISR